MVDDSRVRTRVYLDTYFLFNNPKMDNGTTPLGVQFIYERPDYPLWLELRAPSVEDVIVTIGKPESVPLIGHDLSPYGYVENVPITMYAVDKERVTATLAIWQVEAELRRVTENNPLGSIRELSRIRETTSHYGSVTLHSAEYVLTYVRDTS